MTNDRLVGPNWQPTLEPTSRSSVWNWPTKINNQRSFKQRHKRFNVSQSVVSLFCWEPTKIGCSRPMPKNDKWPNFRAGTFGWRVDMSAWNITDIVTLTIAPQRVVRRGRQPLDLESAETISEETVFLVAVVSSFESLLPSYRGYTAPSNWDICNCP